MRFCTRMSFSLSRSFRMGTEKNPPTWLLGPFPAISTAIDGGGGGGGGGGRREPHEFARLAGPRADLCRGGAQVPDDTPEHGRVIAHDRFHEPPRRPVPRRPPGHYRRRQRVPAE